MGISRGRGCIFCISAICVLCRPRWLQDGPKRRPRRPKTATRGSKRAPSGPKRRQDEPREGPRRPQDGPKSPPSRPQVASKSHSKIILHHKGPQESPKRPQEPPRGPQELPGGPQEAPKEPPRGPQEALKGLPQGHILNDVSFICLLQLHDAIIEDMFTIIVMESFQPVKM